MHGTWQTHDTCPVWQYIRSRLAKAFMSSKRFENYGSPPSTMCSRPIPSAPQSETDENFIPSPNTSSPSAAPATSPLYPYNKVLALLLCWEDEQDGVWREITDLQGVFECAYNFDTEIYRIPSKNPETNLLDKIQELKEKVEKEETLVIVFYGGHGGMVPSKENKPSFEWHALGSDQLAQL